jgi:hypothetical protein
MPGLGAESFIMSLRGKARCLRFCTLAFLIAAYEIAFPALFIAGARVNPEILRAADLLANGIEGTKKITLADTARVSNMEKPGGFNWLVLDFLSRV